MTEQDRTRTGQDQDQPDDEVESYYDRAERMSMESVAEALDLAKRRREALDRLRRQKPAPRRR